MAHINFGEIYAMNYDHEKSLYHLELALQCSMLEEDSEEFLHEQVEIFLFDG